MSLFAVSNILTFLWVYVNSGLSFKAYWPTLSYVDLELFYVNFKSVEKQSGIPYTLKKKEKPIKLLFWNLKGEEACETLM